jgi:tRNA threonylcarbamoyladenosine biosynthesis protein TsaB
VVACLDARMGEIYHAAYRRENGAWRSVCEPGVCRPEHAPPLPGAGWTACGSGFAAYPAQLQAHYAGQLESVDAAAVPHAAHIAALAAIMLAHGEGIGAELAAPIYLRDKVALKMHER